MDSRTPVEVSVIIVSYNTREFLSVCLSALYGKTAEPSFEVIVVDNASSDGSADMAAQQFPAARLIRNSDNLGYAGAVNQAMRESRGRYFLILNPDIEVNETSVANLWAFMESNRSVGIAAAKLINPDGSLQMSARTFYTVRTVLLRRTFLGKIFPNSEIVRKHLMLDWDHNSEREVDWVIGASMMVRREAYEAVGGMDERFFLYLEDVDWCYRMKKHGWSVYYVPASVMKHYHRRESARLLPDRQLVAHLLSTVRFFDKWNSAVYGMKRERWVFSLAATLASDLVFINLAFVAAYYWRYVARGFLTKPLYGLGIYEGLIVFANVVCILSLLYSGFYRRRRRTTFVRDLVGVARAMLVGTLVLMASTYLTRTITYSRVVILIFWPFSTVLVTAGRAAGRAIHRRARESFFDRRRFAVVGEDADAAELRERVLGSQGGEYDFVGYVAPVGRTAARELKPFLGDTSNITGLVVEHRLNELYVCDRGLSRSEVGQIVVGARRVGAEVKVVSEITDMLIRGSLIEEIGGTPVVAFPAAGLSGIRLATKRASDFIFALVAIVLLACLSPVVLLAQTLGGRNYAPLGTSFGNLWSVVTGRWSLAGPRRTVSGEGLKPGITGPWRGLPEMSVEERDRLDMYYVQNWSLSYDAELVLEEVARLGALFRGRPAARASGRTV